MTEQLWKVHVRYNWVAPGEQKTSRAFVLVANDIACLGRQVDISQWLEANGRQDHLVNIYDNKGHGLCVVVSDRNTALMLKLALV